MEQPQGAVTSGDRLMADRLLAAIEQLNESIVLTDAEDRFVLANRAFRELNRNVAHAIQPGQKFEDYMRAGLAAGNYPDAVGREQEWLEARLAERRNPGTPVERQRCGGRWFLIDDRRLPDGSTIRFGTEITDRRRAEAVANERNRDLQLIVDSVPVMISRANRDERYVFVNRAYEHLMERTSAELLGRSIGEVVPPEVYAQVKPDIDRVIAGETVRFERTQLRSDGETRDLDVLYVPDLDNHGRSVGWFALHWDVTERKRAEQALAASEARFRAIFERSSAGMAITDASGTYLSVNAAFARFFGYAAEDIVGKFKVSDLRSVEDTDGAALYQQLVSGEIAFFERDRPYQRKDGAQIWGRSTVSAVRDAGGKAPYVVAVFSDITEEVRARARIERMNAELEERVESRTAELREAMKELDAFTYSVSHDLRAPIGAVSGFAHLLRSAEAARLSEDGRRLLDFIEHNAERMTRLIEGLLRFSRLGRSDLRRTRVSMNGMAGESLLDFVDEAARARINAGSMPDCNGDPALLSQVWSNLMGNALKYSRGADLPCIDIGWDASRNAYYVRDNGVGFDMTYAGKLFGVFERLHAESEFEGSGIGLAIAERIVRLHGGAIWADASPGHGATFWFTVPANGNDAAPEPRSSPDTPR